MFQSFITKDELVNRIQRTVKLFFYRKNIKGSKVEQLEIIKNFVERSLKVYNFKCDFIDIEFLKNGIQIKLKNLRRYKDRQRLDFLPESLISLKEKNK